MILRRGSFEPLVVCVALSNYWPYLNHAKRIYGEQITLRQAADQLIN